MPRCGAGSKKPIEGGLRPFLAIAHESQTHQQGRTIMPDMNQLAEWMRSLLDLAKAHLSSILGGILALAAAAFAWWRARLAWKKRRFLHRVNFSLNYVQGNALKFRTLRESDIDDVLLNNKHAVDLVTKLAERTTLDDPFLGLPRDEAWVVLNSVLNELSEQFAAGFLATSMGLPTRAEKYVLGLTCEKDPDVRINKVRVMIIAESLLQKIEGLPGLAFEKEHHQIRLKTLIRMAQTYRDPKRRHLLLVVELMLPAERSTAAD